MLNTVSRETRAVSTQYLVCVCVCDCVSVCGCVYVWVCICVYSVLLFDSWAVNKWSVILSGSEGWSGHRTFRYGSSVTLTEESFCFRCLFSDTWFDIPCLYTVWGNREVYWSNIHTSLTVMGVSIHSFDAFVEGKYCSVYFDSSTTLASILLDSEVRLII